MNITFSLLRAATTRGRGEAEIAPLYDPGLTQVLTTEQKEAVSAAINRGPNGNDAGVGAALIGASLHWRVVALESRWGGVGKRVVGRRVVALESRCVGEPLHWRAALHPK